MSGGRRQLAVREAVLGADRLHGLPRAKAQQLVDQGLASFDLKAPLTAAAPPIVAEKANGALTAAASGDIGLTFVQPWEGFAEGQSAGFSEGLARRLIASGAAVLHVPTVVPRRSRADIRASLAGR